MNDYIAGGFFLVPRIPRPDGMSSMLPRNILTLSNCFADVAPDMWAVDWEDLTDQDRAIEAAKFGIPAKVIPELVKWFSTEIGPDYPNAFASATMAQEFSKRFVTRDRAATIGIGLHKTALPSFNAQLNKDVNRGLGLVERLQRGQALPDGGTLQGYEPLGYSGMHFHTWLCHISADEVNSRLGIRPNENGLIPTLEEGIQVVRYLTETGAEPAIWEPWIVVEYPSLDSTELGRKLRTAL
jgi:hypothetical protein